MNFPHPLLSIRPSLIPAISCLFILLFPLFPVYSQNSAIPSSQRDSLLQVRNDLLDKSQNQKTWAWVTMGAGIPVTALGVGRAVFGPEDMLLIGLGMIVGSIILFSKANKNQTKALKMDLGFIPYLRPFGHIKYVNKMRSSSQTLHIPKAVLGIRFSYYF